MPRSPDRSGVRDVELRAVYRGNGIPLPWGNMSLVSDPCPRWAVFQMLRQPPEQIRAKRGRAARYSGGEAAIPATTVTALRSVSEVLGIEWIGTALARPASIICPRSNGCPREPRGCPATHHAA